jgi:hypothetical protein
MIPYSQSPKDQARSFLMRKPRRISITISDYAYEALMAKSCQQGRSLSNLSAYLLESSIDQIAS